MVKVVKVAGCRVIDWLYYPGFGANLMAALLAYLDRDYSE
jgi:hypothetical protein